MRGESARCRSEAFPQAGGTTEVVEARGAGSNRRFPVIGELVDLAQWGNGAHPPQPWADAGW